MNILNLMLVLLPLRTNPQNFTWQSLNREKLYEKFKDPIFCQYPDLYFSSLTSVEQCFVETSTCLEGDKNKAAISWSQRGERTPCWGCCH